MRRRRKHSPATADTTTLTFPTHLETPEQTIARFELEQAAHVAKIVTRR